MIQLIRANPTHIELIVRHGVELLRTLGWDSISLGLTAASVREHLEENWDDGPICFLACKEREVVGGCALAFMRTLPTTRDPNGVDAYLHNLFVEPDWRKQVIAGQVIRQVLEECSNMGVDKVFLLAANATSTLYGRLGFKRRGDHFVHHLNGKMCHGRS
jgi:N-acetylglutamate synthase-like GNAT family acetyltransferase